MTPRSVILAVASVREFFQEAVTAALQHLALHPNEATETYLVDLLCERAKAEAMDLHQALAVIMAESQFSLPAQSMLQLKQVGDQSLYVAGYFSDSLRRSQLDPSYYILLGTTAYRRLSRVLRRTRNKTHLIIVYSELGQEFTRFVQVLNDVKQQTAQPSPEIGELYEEWLRTGSETAAQQLQAAGIFLLKPSPLKQ